MPLFTLTANLKYILLYRGHLLIKVCLYVKDDTKCLFHNIARNSTRSHSTKRQMQVCHRVTPLIEVSRHLTVIQIILLIFIPQTWLCIESFYTYKASSLQCESLIQLTKF
jgi:hypothetical protein